MASRTDVEQKVLKTLQIKITSKTSQSFMLAGLVIRCKQRAEARTGSDPVGSEPEPCTCTAALVLHRCGLVVFDQIIKHGAPETVRDMDSTYLASHT